MNTRSTLPRADVSRASRPLVKRLVDEADRLRVGVSHRDNGTCVVDAGIEAPGGLEAGRLIAEICMGGLGTVTLRASTAFKHWTWQVDVHSTDPVTACLGSQYAGWSLSHGQGKGAFPHSESAALETVALPVYPELEEAQARHVVQTVCDFFKQTPAAKAEPVMA